MLILKGKYNRGEHMIDLYTWDTDNSRRVFDR
jgi:hypothetical protein